MPCRCRSPFIRYITERFLPDKAIDLIDEAAARARLKTMEIPANLKDIEHDLEEVRKEKEAAVTSQEFEKAARLRDTERKISEELEEKKKDWQSRRYQEKPLVSFDDIATIVSEWTNIPVTQLTEEETQRLLGMEEEIHLPAYWPGRRRLVPLKTIRRAGAA